MSVYEKLLDVQNELKAPKSQYNKFGNYNYRNCEDILEAVKPICKKHKAVVFLSDKLVMNGERYYIEATATFIDVETNETIEVTAYAREEESKKGMDGSQVTGASSSYARKYALNGLFDVDDTKDSDFTNTKDNQTTAKNQRNYQSEKQDVKQKHLGDEQRNYQSEINTYSALLAENGEQSAEEWIAKAKERYNTPKGQADVLIKWWNKTNKDKQ